MIGFVGAPFTLCSYIIEGGTSKEFLKTKHFMLSEKKEFDKAMEIISESITNYLIAQIDAGVDAVQIFDSWVGFLNLDQYNSFLFQPMKELIKKVKTKNKPVILYSQPCLHLLPSLAKLEPDVISVDWRVDLKQVVDILNKEGFTGAIQGNLDPVVTTLNWDQAKPYVDKVLEQARNAEIRNRYIFNVGHGVNPSTKADTLKEIVDYVHSY